MGYFCIKINNGWFSEQTRTNFRKATTNVVLSFGINFLSQNHSLFKFKGRLRLRP